MNETRDRSRPSRLCGVVKAAAGVLGLAAVAACGSGSAVLGAGGAAGSLAGAGAGGAAGEVAGPSCASLPALQPLLTGLLPSAHGLRVLGDSLFFLDTSAGTPGLAGASGGVARLGIDGSGEGILYAAPAGDQLLDVIARADSLYLLQQEPSGMSNRVFLYQMPQGGGIPTRVSATSAGWAPSLVHFVGVDTTSVYLVNQDDTSGKARLTRVDVSDGAETPIALATTIRSAQLIGTAVWFYDGASIYETLAHAGGPAATQVGTLSCSPRTMSVTGRAIFCGGGLGITRLDLQATMATSVLDLTAMDPGEVNPSPPDGTSIYVAPMPTETEGIVLGNIPSRGLRRLDDNGSVTLVSCNRGIMHDIVFSPTDLYWIESLITASGAVDTEIFRLPK